MRRDPEQARSLRAREVAEALLNNSSHPDHSNIMYSGNQPNSQSIYRYPGGSAFPHNRADYFHDSLVTGISADGHISPVRRFFCLFVTFDLLFTVLMWIICFVITGQNLWDEVVKQVAKYTIQTSLFDVVIASAARFICLILFYAILAINHWWVVALTTSGSSAFLMTKVFLYTWPSTTNYTIDVLLILSSFIISWGEAWFLDFRVFPQEVQAREFLRALPGEGDFEPLLSGTHSSARSIADLNQADFYSPIETPEGSDDETANNRTLPRLPSLSAQDDEYCKKAIEAFNESWATLNADDWKVEKQTPEGDIVHSKFVRRNHKIFKITGPVDIAPKVLLEELYNNIENLPTWNPTLLECRTLKIITENTSISYQVAAEGGGGLVSSRDFVNLRHWGEIDNSYVCSGVSIVFPGMPPQKNHVRGENGPGCWVMRPVPGEPNKCIFQWLLDTNLKGWLPQSLIDTALSHAMIDYIKHVRNYAAKLRNQGASA